MNTPKISVLMPVYNAEKYLKEAIDSILKQTFKDFEFLIINDASTDRSKEIILSYKDPRIRYFKNKKNLGIARTLNRGLKLAKGKYIARMDADDISFPQRLEIEHNEITKDDKVAIVASYYKTIDENGKYLYTVKDACSAEEIYYSLQFRNCLGHPTVLFNKEIILNEFQGYQNCQAEDYELWLRISKKYKILKVNNVLHQLRISNVSRVARYKGKIMNSAIKIAQSNLQLLIGKSISVEVARIFANINPLSNSLTTIKEVLTTLEKVNMKMMNQHLWFLDKSIIKECCDSKNSTLRHYQLIIILFNSKLGFIFKSIYKAYRLIKHFFNKYQFN